MQARQIIVFFPKKPEGLMLYKKEKEKNKEKLILVGRHHLDLPWSHGCQPFAHCDCAL